MLSLNPNHMDFLERVANEDIAGLREKEKQYGSSWLRRGGQGAYFVAIRKFDRLEVAMPKYGYDIFKAAEEDKRAEGILDDIRDMRRYLLLWEAEILARRERSREPLVPRQAPDSLTLKTDHPNPHGYNPELDDV